MAISPKKEQLNLVSATRVVGQGSEVADSEAANSEVTDSESIQLLLAEVKTKVKAQLAKEASAAQTVPSSIQESSSITEVSGAEAPVLEPPVIEAPPVIAPPVIAPSAIEPPVPVSDASQDIDPAHSRRQQSLSHSELPTFAMLEVQQMAAEGYFQAIAYWLNEVLVPQNVYAKVLADEVAGRIKVLVEFERAPQQKRLTRFVCDRLYKLDSNVIEGVHLLVRPIGEAQISWEKAIRIPTADERNQRRQSASPEQASPEQASPEQAKPSTPQIPTPHTSKPQLAKTMVRRRFKFFRAAFVCGSAFAAFVLGGFLEMLWSERLIGPAASHPADAIAPWYGETNEPDIFQSAMGNPVNRDAFSQGSQIPPATAISFRPASRFPGRTVEAALETVAVIPHRDVANPNDPTVTLMFGGELALNDFTFKDTTDLDNLFSDIDIYRQADVAMMGLAEPLAYASTSLQEDFYQRTRPQAVNALKSGGIDIVGLASDGSMVHGSRGLSETLSNLDRQGIYRVGAGRNQQEAHRPEILEVKGQRIAYLGYSSDALKGARKEKAGVALTQTDERSHIKEDIQAIRQQVDWVVVSYRWGEESMAQETPSEPTDDTDLSGRASIAKAPQDWQKVLAREAIDAGADLVVGSHPRQIQGIEVYRDRPIAYSLGDFAFSRDPQTDSLSARDTAALKISLRNQRMKVEFIPVTLTDAKLQRANGEKGSSLLQSIRNASKPLERPLQFPAVLTPEPLAKDAIPAQSEVTPTESWTPEPDAPAVPEAPNAMPGVVEVIQVEPAQPDPTQSEPIQQKTFEDEGYTVPSPDPMMQESEALFMPEEQQPAQQAEEQQTEAQQTEEKQLEQQLDVQWQDDEWQKHLQDAKESWEAPSSNLAPILSPVDSEHSESGYREETLGHEADVISETLPAEVEILPWQDPFSYEALDWEAPTSVDPSPENPDAASTHSPNVKREDSSLEGDGIRPYAEPIIGPLSLVSTPST